MPDLIALAVPGNRPSLEWLAYPRYTPSNNGK